ncbi:MAG: M56 family metallopeptidase [Bacteroidetes bacterium]|nr:M56 family metallopeptidase [Bacteroidota bacterium]
MNDYIEYLLQSGICLGVFYIIFWLFMRNDTSFIQNRLYLIFSIIISTIAPFAQIHIPVSNETTAAILLEEIIVTPHGMVNSLVADTNFPEIILMIYLAGVFFMSVRLIYQLLQIMIIIKRYGIIRYRELYIVNMKKEYAPFSILNLIFINSDLNDRSQLEKIISHERVHVRQKHTIDLMIMELMAVVQWFNPFVWLLKHAVKINHEYLADEGVLKAGHDKVNYQRLLLNQVFGMQICTLTNNFNQSLIKRRLTMMSKNRNNHLSGLKLVLLVPVTLAFAMFFSISFSAKVMAQEEAQLKQKQQQQQLTDKDAVFTVVEKMPTFKGGPEAFAEYFSTNVKYPDIPRKKGIDGTSFVTFIVEKDGSISNVELLRGFNDACDQEAVRVVKAMPAWNPGMEKGKAVRVKFNVPVKFVLDKEEKVLKGEARPGTPPPPPKGE